MAVGRVAVAATAALLLLTGCGEREEPVAEVSVERVEAVQAADPAMARLVDALGLRAERERGAEGARPAVVVAWATDLENAEDARRAGGFVGAASTLDEVVESIAKLGVRLGAPGRAREVVRTIGRAREEVRAAVRRRPPVRVFVDLGFYATAGERTLIGDMIREAGGENVAGATPEPGPFPLRLLRERDPEVYVMSSDARTRPEDVRANPRTRGITAVREGRFAIVAAEALAPGPLVGDGLLALARALHPDALD